MEKVSKKNPTISIIVPVYNGEKYIKNILDNLIKIKCNKEIIIVNDCSKDNVDDVVSKYLDDPRVKYIHNKENLGVARTRNKGVYLSEGRYVAFLDSDDWFEQDMMERARRPD